MKSYIELVNRFWNADMNCGGLSHYATRLYFFLLKSCNENFWKMPIGHSDRYLADRLGMSVNTLRQAKLSLSTMELIVFKTPEKASRGVAGQTKFYFPTVSSSDTVNTVTVSRGDTVKDKTVSPDDTVEEHIEIEPYHPVIQTVSSSDTVNTVTVSRGDTVKDKTVSPDDTVEEHIEIEPYHPVIQTVSSSDTVTPKTVSPSDTNNKTIYKTEDNNTIPKGIVSQKPPKDKKVKKKKSSSAPAETTKFWDKVVEAWFLFYENKFNEKPTFGGSAPKDLKSIITLLEKKAKERGFDWTEEQAVASINTFLEWAYKSDRWLQDNFLLLNLNRQFDKIIAYAKAGSNKKSVDAGVSIINEIYNDDRI